MEFGIIDKILTDATYWASQCATINADDGLRPLTIFDFLGVFAIFVSGEVATIDVHNQHNFSVYETHLVKNGGVMNRMILFTLIVFMFIYVLSYVVLLYIGSNMQFLN